MKIARKMLLSYLLIVALFASIGAVLTLNTMQMNQLQADVNKKIEIGNYVNTFQKAIDLKKLAFIEGNMGNIEQAAIDTQTANSLIEPCQEYLLANLPPDSELYAEFYECYQILNEVINPAAEEVDYIYANGLTDRYDEVTSIYVPILASAYAEIGANLDEFNLIVIESIVEASDQSQSYATFSIVLAAVGISVIAVVSIALAIVMSKKITNPLKKLTDIAGKVSMGELEHQIEFNTKDEISELGEAFQRMINAFKMTSAMNELSDKEEP